MVPHEIEQALITNLRIYKIGYSHVFRWDLNDDNDSQII